MGLFTSEISVLTSTTHKKARGVFLWTDTRISRLILFGTVKLFFSEEKGAP